MQKKILLTTFFLISGLYIAFAQQVTGRITSSEDNEGIPGTNVVIKGTTHGTITDIDGKFTIEAEIGDILLISFVGMQPTERVVRGNTPLNISLEPLTETLTDVIVTALGLKRDEKALGYAVQKVDGDEIAQAKELDVVNSLSGKVSGVNIIQADGSIGGGGSRIVIRGESSLAGNNDPLFIINGIPGNANDIASDDIESISVLKGAAAAALYGAKAGAGVVLITSKSGKQSKGMQIDFNSNITFQSPLVLPDYQNEYGMGSGGAYSYFDGNTKDEPYLDDTHLNWGPKFDGKLRSQFTGNNPWVAFEDNVKDFYQTGHIFINNISISNSSEMGNYRFSYSNTNQKGILPNTGLAKDNLTMNSTFKINDKISFTSNFSYIRTKCDNNKQVDVRFFPRNIDISALKDYWIPGMEGVQQFNYRRSANNPYFELYENKESYIDSKVIANFTLNIDITRGLSLMGRYGTDYTNNEYYSKNAKSTFQKYISQAADGYYRKGFANSWNRTAEFLLSYENKIFGVFNAKLSAGGTHYRSEYKKLDADTYSLTYAEIWNLNNRDGYLNGLGDYKSALERNSLYVFLNTDYRGIIFLDVTRRDDWSSTLHPDNNHFSYHSAVVSALISDMVNLPSAFSFWKFRASIAQVGNDIPVPYYTIEEKNYLGSKPDGLTVLTPSSTRTDPYLKPEITTGYEVGMDMRFFNNRLGLDITYYYSDTKNQILNTEISNSTGFEKMTLNAGEIESKGVELTLNATPVKYGDLTWETQINFSLDRSYLVEFNDSIDSKTQQVNAHLAIEDRPGQRRGTFYGRAYELAPNGKRLYTSSGDTRLTENTVLGNYNPDWMASMNNTITYKDLSLSFLLDLRWGGLIYNEIERKLNMYGLSAATTLNDREGIVPDGMVELADGTYRELTLDDLIEAGKSGGQSGQEYWATQMEETAPLNELIDDTFLKLRELRLAYNLPKHWAKKAYMESMTIAIVGRNLAVWSKVKHTDPETFGYAWERNDFGFSTKIPGYANSNMPSVRSYGFTLSCKF
jgi:TonB-linked SusC/RagA family outer membrane protein